LKKQTRLFLAGNAGRDGVMPKAKLADLHNGDSELVRVFAASGRIAKGVVRPMTQSLNHSITP
jgi:hypothetical protein